MLLGHHVADLARSSGCTGLLRAWILGECHRAKHTKAIDEQVGRSDLALGLTKTDRVDPVKPGATVTYGITWSNGATCAQDASGMTSPLIFHQAA